MYYGGESFVRANCSVDTRTWATTWTARDSSFLSDYGSGDTKWVIDSGASSHIFGNHYLFLFVTSPIPFVMLADGSR